MVTALLRALGFDDETEAPPGEGQDRAPVGAGQDVPEDVTQARQRATRGAADPWIGTPYHLGGNDQKNVDCSGLVNALLRGFGANIPGRPNTGTYRSQLASPIPWESIQPGDVLISPANRADPVSGEHMALYVGGGQMVEATGPEGAPARYSAVTNRNLQPYRLREPVPGLQQVTLLAQREGDLPQQPPAAGGSAAPAGPASVQQVAIQALRANDPTANNGEIADIMAAGALFESGANPQGPPGDGNQSFGLWQLHSRGLGAGMTEAQRRDPPTAAARIAPEYQRAYAEGSRRGFEGADLATYTYINAEHPANDPAHNDMRHAQMGGPTAQAFQQKYVEVDAHSRQQQELQIGGGYAPPAGAPGQANAQAPSGPLQQAWAAAQTGIQQLLSQAGGAAMAAGGAVAGLGATPAHAEALSAGPPPGPTPQVQQPPPDPEAQARAAAAARETALAQSRNQELGQAPGAVGNALSQPALQWGGGRNAPPPTPTAPAPAPPPAAPTDYGPGGFAGAAQAAGGAPGGMIRPSGAPVTSLPGQPGAPATAPAAGIAETAPPAPGLPPDTETEHWDNNIRAWVPKTPPTTFQGGGRWRIVGGPDAAARDPITGALASNEPGTPVEYVPIQAGYHDTPQGRQYWDSTTQQWHQPTGPAAQGQTAATALAPGLSFVPGAPNSRSGTVFWEDPNTHAVTQAPYTLGDPMPSGLGQPQQAPLTASQQATQQTATAQLELDRQRLQESIRTANLSDERDRQRIQNEMDQFNQRMTASQRSEDRQYTDLTAEQRRQASIPTVSGTHLYGPDPNNPDPNAPPIDLGPVPQTPGQEASTAFTQAQTTRLTQESSLPEVRGNRLYTPVTNPDTGVSSYQDTGPVPMSASEQALADERAREFGTLSAYQQSQAEQSKADLTERQSEFSQNLAEKQAESARPYSQMTKAEQAQDARAQQELGLKKEQLGLSEAEAANKLENLPRGGIMRVDPFTGQSSLINAPEPEDIRMVGSQIYIPGGRQVSLLGQQISGGPNPYAGVPTGGGGMFPYPGAQGGGMGAQQPSPYQNWGGQGGGGWGGQQGMSSSPGWQQPRQQQGWMGSGY